MSVLPSPRQSRPAHRAPGEARTDPRPASAGAGRRVREGAWSDERGIIADMRAAYPTTAVSLDRVLDELLVGGVR